jgi:hypothetical protein
MREYPIAIPLTDSVGVNLTGTNGIFAIIATGAQTKYFYISYDGLLHGEIMNIKYAVDDAVTLVSDLEVYIGSSWIPIPAYYTGVITDDGSSQEWNGSYPLRELITNGIKIRVAVTVSGAATIYCQVIGFKV